jgi:hypothetical protein
VARREECSGDVMYTVAVYQLASELELSGSLGQLNTYTSVCSTTIHEYEDASQASISGTVVIPRHQASKKHQLTGNSK